MNSRKPGRLAAVPASQPAMTTRTAPDRAAGESARRTTRAAYTALGWVVLFFAFHVYWYLGGSFASPGKLPGGPHTLLAWIFEVFVTGAFPLGAFVCLAIARGWARDRPAPERAHRALEQGHDGHGRPPLVRLGDRHLFPGRRDHLRAARRSLPHASSALTTTHVLPAVVRW